MKTGRQLPTKNDRNEFYNGPNEKMIVEYRNSRCAELCTAAVPVFSV